MSDHGDGRAEPTWLPAPAPGRPRRHWLRRTLVATGLLALVLTTAALADGDGDGDDALPPGDGHPDLPAATVGSSPEWTGTTAQPAPGRPPVAACIPAEAGGAVFRLVASDDFEGPLVDTAAWTLYDSPGNAGHGLRRPAAITTRDGLLVITARMIGDDLVSGGMAHNLNQTYGRWEFRVRTDPDPSGATSGVVLTWPASGRWPIDGENDMYETQRTPNRTPFHSFIHFGADNDQEELIHDADGTEWHEMAMEWTPDRLIIFRDGELAGEVQNPDAIPHVPHHMTIQLDAWTGTMGDPVTMEVDWMRVYEFDDGGRC